MIYSSRTHVCAALFASVVVVSAAAAAGTRRHHRGVHAGGDTLEARASAWLDKQTPPGTAPMRTGASPSAPSRHTPGRHLDRLMASDDEVIRTAYAYRGTPYRRGGDARGGFDCSGFTRYVYGRMGIELPHSARAQFRLGQSVERGALQPGDLVFFQTVTPGISHVGIYAGSGRFVHSSSRRSGGVRVDSLADGYYRGAYRGARRVRQTR